MKLSVLNAVYFIAFSIFLISNCTSPTAGGTTDTGNAKVAAVIYASDGQPACRAKVILTPVNYISEIGADSELVRDKFIKETITDDSGRFTIPSVDTGNYFVEINDRDSSAVLVKINVRLSNEPIVSFTDTLRAYSAIEGCVGNISDTAVKRFLLIYGMDRKILIGNDGIFTVNDLPAGTYHLKIIAQNDSDFLPVEYDSLTVAPSQTLKLPVAGWSHSSEIIFNTTSSGAEISADVYNFPVLIRLNNDNFDFSQANGDGSDCRFVTKNFKFLQYDIESWDSINNKAFIWVLIDTVIANSNTQSITMLWGNSQAHFEGDEHEVFDTVNGFLGTYHLSGNINDATANGYDGIDSGTFDYSKGVIGRARTFDGYKSYFTLGDLPDRPSGTIYFWFKLARSFDSNSATTQGIWGKVSYDSIDFNISLRGTDHYIDPNSTSGSYGTLITKMESDTDGFYLESTIDKYTSGTWYHAAWSWGNNGSVLYINGVLQDSSLNYLMVKGHADDEVGRSRYDSSNTLSGLPRYFYGALDEFRIDDVKRDENWIKLCFYNQSDLNLMVKFKPDNK